MKTGSRRLSKERRRDQLLTVAMDIVRDQGTDALTLGYLAERAGVSKPIPYDHFETRSGLLIALFTQIDDQKVAVLIDALKRAPRRLESVARVVSEAYMDCYLSNGVEWHSITAALKGDEKMDAVHRQLVDSYVDIYCGAFAPYSDFPAYELRIRCVAIVGAAEALSQDLVRERIDRVSAIDHLTAIIVAWTGTGAPTVSGSSRRTVEAAR